MPNDVLLFPSLSEELSKRLRFQKTKYAFFYTDKNKEEHELKDEPVEAYSSINCIKDDDGVYISI